MSRPALQVDRLFEFRVDERAEPAGGDVLGALADVLLSMDEKTPSSPCDVLLGVSNLELKNANGKKLKGQLQAGAGSARLATNAAQLAGADA